MKRREILLPLFAGSVSLFALIQLFCIALGLLHLPMSRPAALAILLVSIVLSVLFASRFRGPAGTGEPDEPDDPAGAGGLFQVLPWLAIVWAVVTWVRLLRLVLRRPVLDWDGLYYHVPAIHDWVVRGHVSFVDTIPDVPTVNYPMGVELTSFLAHYLTGSSALVDGGNLWYWPLGALALTLIAAKLGARRVWAASAGALLFGSSVFVSQSASAYIDPGFACTVMASIAAALVFVFPAERGRLREGVLFGLAAGLMLGSKGFGLPFAAVLIAGTAVAFFVIHRSAGLRGFPARFGPVLVCLVAVGGYWYIRNAVEIGNPVYPIEVSFGEKVIFPGWDAAAIDEYSVPPWLQEYPGWARPFVAWTQRDAPIHGYGWTAGGLGYLWIAGALPAFFYLLILTLIGRGKKRSAPLALLALLTAGLFGMTTSAWWARLTLWLLALGLPSLAAVLSDAASRWRVRPGHLATLFLGAAVIGVAVWESDRTLRIEWNENLAQAAEGGSPFLSPTHRYVPALHGHPFFDEMLREPRIARSLWVTRSGAFLSGVLAMPLGAREIVVLPPDPDADDIDSLMKSGVRWIIWETEGEKDLPEAIVRRTTEMRVVEAGFDSRLHLIQLGLPR